MQKMFGRGCKDWSFKSQLVEKTIFSTSFFVFVLFLWMFS